MMCKKYTQRGLLACNYLRIREKKIFQNQSAVLQNVVVLRRSSLMILQRSLKSWL